MPPSSRIPVSLAGKPLLPFLQRHLNFLHHLGGGIVPGKEIPQFCYLEADLLLLISLRLGHDGKDLIHV